MRFKDQVAIVTGSSRGIGKSVAEIFAAEGAKVVVSDVLEEEGLSTTKSIIEAGGAAIFVKCNVADSAEVTQLFDRCVAEYGRVDHLVNNAGIGRGFDFFDRITDDKWNETIAVNQTGVFYCMRAALKIMKNQGGGNIVNVSSAAGIGAAPRMAAYAASKHAVIGLTKTAAAEYGKFNIRVNAVCPTVIETDMGDAYLDDNHDMKSIMLKTVPMRRFGMPEEVANTICYLCSNQASYLNGVALPVDGGSKA